LSTELARVEGKVALVTGAASGIGAATARLLAREGAAVLLCDIADTGAVASEIGGAARAMTLDVRDPAGWQAAVAEAEARFGGLHILVNNAGIMLYHGLCDYRAEEIRRVIDINLLGVIFGTQAAAPAIERSGGGAIVNVSSVDGLIAHNGFAPYVASKWGVRGFTKAAALELSHRGVRVNSVHPGGVFTPMANPTNIPKADFDRAGMGGVPLQRTATADEIAAAILFLAGPESSYCTGSELAIDGGMSAGQYIPALAGAPRLS